MAARTDHLRLATFSVMGLWGGGPHALACALALGSRVRRTATVGGLAPADTAGFLDGMMDFNRGHWTAVGQGLEAHTAHVAELAGLLQQDPVAFLAGLASEMAEGDQRQLAAPARYRANLEMLAEAGRQGAHGWIDDYVAIASDWRFRLEEAAGSVRVWHGRADRNVPATHAEYLAAHLPKPPCAGSRTRPAATPAWTCSTW